MKAYESMINPLHREHSCEKTSNDPIQPPIWRKQIDKPQVLKRRDFDERRNVYQVIC